jgi:hypothetical protein
LLEAGARYFFARATNQTLVALRAIAEQEI